MGGMRFDTTAKGETSQEAFENARKEALHWHGHGGYTGTIAEKQSFTEREIDLTKHDVDSVEKLTFNALVDRFPEIDEISKWDEAVCVFDPKNEPGVYRFCGWASC